VPDPVTRPEDRYLTCMGLAPRRIPHWEHWLCPDAETYLTGIDAYARPRQCRLRLSELYPQSNLPVPDSDDPLPRPEPDLLGRSSMADESERHRARWGAGTTSHWDWGA
jgi:hypothetical protein